MNFKLIGLGVVAVAAVGGAIYALTNKSNKPANKPAPLAEGEYAVDNRGACDGVCVGNGRRLVKGVEQRFAFTAIVDNDVRLTISYIDCDQPVLSEAEVGDFLKRINIGGKYKVQSTDDSGYTLIKDI